MSEKIINFFERYGARADFTKMDQPRDFVWPKNIDYAALEERVLSGYAGSREEAWREQYMGEFSSTASTVTSSKDTTLTLDKMNEILADAKKSLDSVGRAPLHLDMSDAAAYSLAPFSRDRGLDFHGVPIRRSALFPMNLPCRTCEGTGEGVDSTYCRKCKGAGEHKVEGVMTSGPGSMTLLTASLPKKFQPSFPKGMVPQPPMCRGLSR